HVVAGALLAELLREELFQRRLVGVAQREDAPTEEVLLDRAELAVALGGLVDAGARELGEQRRLVAAHLDAHLPVALELQVEVGRGRQRDLQPGRLLPQQREVDEVVQVAPAVRVDEPLLELLEGKLLTVHAGDRMVGRGRAGGPGLLGVGGGEEHPGGEAPRRGCKNRRAHHPSPGRPLAVPRPSPLAFTPGLSRRRTRLRPGAVVVKGLGKGPGTDRALEVVSSWPRSPLGRSGAPPYRRRRSGAPPYRRRWHCWCRVRRRRRATTPARRRSTT